MQMNRSSEGIKFNFEINNNKTNLRLNPFEIGMLFFDCRIDSMLMHLCLKNNYIINNHIK